MHSSKLFALLCFVPHVSLYQSQPKAAALPRTPPNITFFFVWQHVHSFRQVCDLVEKVYRLAETLIIPAVQQELCTKFDEPFITPKIFMDYFNQVGFFCCENQPFLRCLLFEPTQNFEIPRCCCTNQPKLAAVASPIFSRLLSSSSRALARSVLALLSPSIVGFLATNTQFWFLLTIITMFWRFVT